MAGKEVQAYNLGLWTTPPWGPWAKPLLRD